LRGNDIDQNMTTDNLMINLSWPPRQLSPNARGHWAALHKVRSRYRAEAHACALGAGAKDWSRTVDPNAALRVNLTFSPPDRRRRDWDNLLAAMKPALDGIADALGVNDARFRLAMDLSADPVTGGRVDVQVSTCQD
jgi:crossover junction endodeoxyribonuclease RusA